MVVVGGNDGLPTYSHVVCSPSLGLYTGTWTTHFPGDVPSLFLLLLFSRSFCWLPEHSSSSLLTYNFRVFQQANYAV